MANGHSAIDSLIANATLQRYQEGGQVKPNLKDYLQQLQKLYGKYQGDVVTESGASKYNPEGMLSEAGLAERYKFPLEQMVLDTVAHDPRTREIVIKGPNRKVKHQQTLMGMTEKQADERLERKDIINQLTAKYPTESSRLGYFLDDANKAIKALDAGYLDMDLFDRMDWERKNKKQGGLVYQKGGKVPKQPIKDTLMENQQLNFVQRILNPELNTGREYYFANDSLKKEPMTHYMIQYDNKVAPTVVDTGARDLKYFDDPEEAAAYAKITGEFIEFKTPEDALWFSKNYKSYAPFKKVYK